MGTRFCGFPCLEKLPDDILTQILSYLNAVDLYNVSCVCQRLSYVVEDKRLWKIVNFGPSPLSLSYLRRFLRYLGPQTIAIRVTGFVKAGHPQHQNPRQQHTRRQHPHPQRPSAPKSTSQCVSEAFLLSLKRRCPNLRELSLRRCFLDALSVKFCLFPKSLRRLCLEGSVLLNLPPTRTRLTSPFRGLEKHLPALQAIDLRHCNSWFTRVDLMLLLSRCDHQCTVTLDDGNYLVETKGWSVAYSG